MNARARVEDFIRKVDKPIKNSLKFIRKAREMLNLWRQVYVTVCEIYGSGGEVRGREEECSSVRNVSSGFI